MIFLTRVEIFVSKTSISLSSFSIMSLAKLTGPASGPQVKDKGALSD
jgi:hypothetical protein